MFFLLCPAVPYKEKIHCVKGFAGSIKEASSLLTSCKDNFSGFLLKAGTGFEISGTHTRRSRTGALLPLADYGRV
ncbi:MAG: hypothetical protein EBY32_05300 [Proteobacteria bacterium]|nr:hypothetical protein [Pseudomonadota bacterium]